MKGFNDLASQRPDIAAEWNYELNADLTPEHVTVGSGRKVWWKCRYGHEWKASVVSRTRENMNCGCPVCGNRQLLVGFNDIGSNKELLDDWNIEKNIIKPEDIIIASGKKVWWKCHICGYEWTDSPSDKLHKHGCPNCNKKKRSKNIQLTYIKNAGGSLADKYPELLEEWDWEKNTDIDPRKIVSGYSKKVWWKCKNCRYEWQATCASRTRPNSTGCPKCGRQKQAASRQATILKNGAITLSVSNPDIAADWDYEKNGKLLPTNVTHGSGRKVWWKCKKCGTEWQAVICERTRGRRKCPFCRNHTD